MLQYDDTPKYIQGMGRTTRQHIAMSPQACTEKLIVSKNAKRAATVANVLLRIPAHILNLAVRAGTTVYILAPKERYSSASGELATLGIDVDTWPAPPAGLFVVKEKTVYLRSISDMTVAHEFGHAVDAALGGGVYRSGTDEDIRRAYNDARSFVTPYACTGKDEFFAEAFRSMLSCNSTASPWPKVSPERLKACNPDMFDIMQALFAPPTSPYVIPFNASAQEANAA